MFFLIPAAIGFVISFLTHMVFIKGSKKNTVFATAIGITIVIMTVYYLIAGAGAISYKIGYGIGSGFLWGLVGYYSSFWMFKNDFIE